MSSSRQRVACQSLFIKKLTCLVTCLFTGHMTACKIYDWLFVVFVNHTNEKSCQ